MLTLVRKIDDAIYAFERVLIVVLVAAMTLAVFGDTVHRIFNEPQGRTERFLQRLLPEGAAHSLAPLVFFALVTLLVYAAIRMSDRKEGEAVISAGKAAARAAGIAALIFISVKGMVWLLPNGLIWSQRMALCAMLWIGFVGASIATRDHSHIVFEVADRIWPKAVQPVVKLVCKMVPAIFSAFLAVLAFGYARFHYLEWAESGVVFDGFAVPKFTVYGFLVFPFLVMGARFLLHGVGGMEIAAIEGLPDEKDGS